MNNMKYDVIFFDADETIYDYKKAEEHSFKNAIIEFVQLDDKDLQNAYQMYTSINKSLWDDYHRNAISKQQILDTRFVVLFDQLNLDIEGSQFGENYLSKLAESQFLMPHAESVLKELSELCTVAVITNGVASVHRNRIDNSVIKGYIKHLIISGDYDDDEFQKPHPKIFEYAHEITDSLVEKQRILMVGDSLISDVQGGNNYGIHTCWLNSQAKTNTTDHKPSYIISKLSELIELVKE